MNHPRKTNELPRPSGLGSPVPDHARDREPAPRTTHGPTGMVGELLMTFEQAWERVTVAGRELGSGPAVAAERIVGDQPIEWLMRRNVFEHNAAAIRLGVAV